MFPKRVLGELLAVQVRDIRLDGHQKPKLAPAALLKETISTQIIPGIYIYIHIYYTHIHVLCVYICVHIYVYTYVYMYIYIYTYTYMYFCIYIHVCRYICI